MANTKAQEAALKKLFKNNWNPNFSASPDADFLSKLGAKLYGTDATKAYAMRQMANLPQAQQNADTLKALQASLMKGSKTPFSTATVRSTTIPLKDGTEQIIEASPFKDTMGIVGQNIAANPGAAFGTALNTGAGIAGLLDNDKFGGQLLGTAAGAIIPAALKMKLGPLAAYNTAMIAGNLGALFDTLRAKSKRLGNSTTEVKLWHSILTQ